MCLRLIGDGMKKTELIVYYNNQLVGYWGKDISQQYYFTYDDSWVNHKEGRPISLSLPFSSKKRTYNGAVVTTFFDNLLPQSEAIRNRIRQRYHAPSNSAFDLLHEIGRDCVGALQIIPKDEILPSQEKLTMVALNEQEIASIIRGGSYSDAQQNIKEATWRISIAGEQEKTALLRFNNRWYTPTGVTPTTHICKFPLGKVGNVDLSDSVEIEWCTLQIYGLLGFPVAPSFIAYAEDERMLCVERFDRAWNQEQTMISRILQEDMCQVLSIPQANKYESDGGPGIKEISAILRGSSNSNDNSLFFSSLFAHWLCASPDRHAKNYSIFIGKKGAYRLTPLYDLISAYPILGNKASQIAPQKLKMAMGISGKNKHYTWQRITNRHFRETGGKIGLPEKTIQDLFDFFYESIPIAINKMSDLIPKGFPQYIPDAIFAGLRKKREKL